MKWGNEIVGLICDGEKRAWENMLWDGGVVTTE